MSNVNRKFTLAARPFGYPKLSDFDLVTEPIPNPQDGEVLVRTNYLSVDPYMRGRMNDRVSYAPNVQIGEAMVGTVVGEGGRFQKPGLSGGRYRYRWVGLAGVWGVRWGQSPESGSNLRSHIDSLGDSRYAGLDGILRLVGDLQPTAGRNGFCVRSGRGCRFFGGTDCKDKGLPRRW